MEDDFFVQYPYLCDTFFINKHTRIEQTEVDAKELLSPYRLDFMAKLYWIEASEGRLERADAYKLYEAHLQAFSHGTLIEPGQSEKKGLNRYHETFSQICTYVKETKSDLIEIGAPIPVDSKHMAMDGAHRISAAFYYAKRVPIYQVYKEIPNKYDYLFFRKRYLGEEDIVKMVKKYVSLCECRLFILDKAHAHRRLIKKIYDKFAPVYMRKTKSGECLVIIDWIWIKRFADVREAEELLGIEYVEGTEAILNCLTGREAELLKQGRMYEYRKKWNYFSKKYGDYFKIWMKKLLGKPI